MMTFQVTCLSVKGDLIPVALPYFVSILSEYEIGVNFALCPKMTVNKIVIEVQGNVGATLKI